MRNCLRSGGVAEWSIALVLKTRVSQGTMRSNLTPSALANNVVLPAKGGSASGGKTRVSQGTVRSNLTPSALANNVVLPAKGGSASGGKTRVSQGTGRSNLPPS